MRFLILATLLGFGFAAGRRMNEQAQKPVQPGQQATIPGAVLVTQEPHHHLLYANDDLRVFDVIVPPHQSTLLHEHDYDYIFITFGESKVTVAEAGMPEQKLDLPDGAVRFAKGGFAHILTNDSNQPFHNMTIEFLTPGIAGRGCTCNGGGGDAICNCPGAKSLPENWSKQIGRLSLEGITVPPGGMYDDSSNRQTRILVPLTPYEVLDTSIHSQRPRAIRMPVGRFHWLSPGPHKLQNVSGQPLRFVSVEF